MVDVIFGPKLADEEQEREHHEDHLQDFSHGFSHPRELAGCPSAGRIIRKAWGDISSGSRRPPAFTFGYTRAGDTRLPVRQEYVIEGAAMASRHRENGTSPGVILSVTLSIASFALSFFTFYFEHLRSSEAVDALLSNLYVKIGETAKIERVTLDLMLVNKGDTPVTVSELWFDVDGGTGTGCCGRLAALKENEDTVIVPIEVPSKHVRKVSIAFRYQFLAPPVILGLSSGTEGTSREPIPPPPEIKLEKISIALSLITVGSAYGYQEMKTPIGLLHVDGIELRSYGSALVPTEFISIRKDPSLFKSLWLSLTN
jgi:hypothetical protein